MQAKTFAVMIAILILFFVIELIRRQRMTFKYCLFWLGSSMLVIVLAWRNDLLVKISRLAGFTLPSNFIFFLALVLLIFLSLMLTLYINEQNSRTETLAQSIGLLEERLRRMQAGAGQPSEKEPQK